MGFLTCMIAQLDLRRPLWKGLNKRLRWCSEWQSCVKKASGPKGDYPKCPSPQGRRLIGIICWRRCSGLPLILLKSGSGRKQVPGRCVFTYFDFLTVQVCWPKSRLNVSLRGHEFSKEYHLIATSLVHFNSCLKSLWLILKVLNFDIFNYTVATWNPILTASSISLF